MKKEKHDEILKEVLDEIEKALKDKRSLLAYQKAPTYKVKELPSGVKHFMIVFWEKIGKNRGSFLNKLYGFKVKNKYYTGLLFKFNGKKLGKSCIMLPIQYKKVIFKLLKKHEVKAKIMEVFS